MDSLKPFVPYRNPELYYRRVKMLGNGFPTINCEFKIHVDEGWSSDVIDQAYLERKHSRKGSKWRGAGIRLTPGMAVWDFDIKDYDILEAVFDDLESDPEFAALMDGALWRTSGGISWALFMQASAPIAGHHSATFGRIQADGSVTGKAHIEVWGGAAIRYFAACGPHSDGREYDFEGPAPWDTRLDSLPVFDADQVGRLIDRVEAVLARFLTRLEGGRKLEGGNVYDLTEDSPFVLKDRTVTSVGELERTLQRGVSFGPRGCMSLEEWEQSDSHERCHAYCRSKGAGVGRMTITNFYDATQHYYVDEEPAPPFELSSEATERLKAMHDNAASGEATEPEPEPKPGPDAWLLTAHSTDDIKRDANPVLTHNNAVDWLGTRMAFFPQAFKSSGGAISIWPNGEYQTPVAITALKHAMKGFGYVEEGPRGGRRFINPVDTWLGIPELIRVHGLRMRPELPRPLFTEDSTQLINRYAPPIHPATGGEIRTWLRFMQRLVYNPLECAWVRSYIAFKFQHPELRMVGLAMVAHEHGSGRGLFAETLQLLLGERFVVPLRYGDITGDARFNGQIEDRLIVYVNEARTAESNRYGNKTQTREALRVFIEPNHRVQQLIERKGIDAYHTRLAATTLIFANSIKAVPIDEHDRRTTVVMNGPQMSVAERDEYQAWMLKPENIGALYRYLMAYKVETDRDVFDPYMAPMFVGRDLMIEANQSSIDRAWFAAIGRLKQAADLYATDQAVTLTRLFMQAPGNDLTGTIRDHVYEKGHRIGTKRPNEKNWLTRFGAAKDNRQAVFAHSESEARQWTSASAEQIHAELIKAQKAVDEPAQAVNKLLKLVKPPVKDE